MASERSGSIASRRSSGCQSNSHKASYSSECTEPSCEMVVAAVAEELAEPSAHNGRRACSNERAPLADDSNHHGSICDQEHGDKDRCSFTIALDTQLETLRTQLLTAHQTALLSKSGDTTSPVSKLEIPPRCIASANGLSLAKCLPLASAKDHTLHDDSSPMTSEREVYESDEMPDRLPNLPTLARDDFHKGTASSAGSASNRSSFCQMFEVFSVWEITERVENKGPLLARTQSFLSSVFSEDSEDTEQVIHQSCEFMLQPKHQCRLAWDILGLGLIAWDLIWVPLLLLDPPEGSFTNFMSWLARIFWSLDIFATCITGYFKTDGALEMRPKHVLRHYLRTWLVFDLLIVAADWVEAMLVSSLEVLSVGRLSRAARTMRLLRLIRLARVLKLGGLLSSLTERILSERFVLILQIAKSTAMVVVYTHVIACLWFGVGTSRYQDTHGWVAEYEFDVADLEEKYFVSLHWAISQFTSSMEVYPQHLLERIFCVFMILVAFLFAAGFVSTITTAMTRFHMIDVEQHMQFSALRRYLWHSCVTLRLSTRVMRNAQHATTQKQREISEADVNLLNLLSEPIKVELHYEVYSRVLRAHPLMQYYGNAEPVGLRQICHRSVTVLNSHRGDVLFGSGERPEVPQMFFVVHGAMRYMQQGMAHEELRAQQWACEMVLWTKWKHRGALRCLVDCKILEVNAEVFQHIAGDPERLRQDGVIVSYAKHFVNQLNNCEDDDISDLDTIDLSAASVLREVLVEECKTIDGKPFAPCASNNRGSFRGSFSIGRSSGVMPADQMNLLPLGQDSRIQRVLSGMYKAGARRTSKLTALVPGETFSRLG